MSNIFEIVTFRVKDPAKAKEMRRNAMEHARKLKGFVNYRAMINVEDQNHFSDLVEWKSLEDAQAAAQEIMTIPEFQAMMAEIDSVESMKHFSVDKFIE